MQVGKQSGKDTFRYVSWGNEYKELIEINNGCFDLYNTHTHVYINIEMLEYLYLFWGRSSANTNPGGIGGTFTYEPILVKVDIWCDCHCK